MRRDRLVRVGAAIVAVLALVGISTPPAAATSVITVHTVGTMSTSRGLDLPCRPGTSKPCPPPVTTQVKGGPKNLSVVNVGVWGNAVSFSYGNAPLQCVFTATNVGKFSKNVVETGPCAVSLSGVLEGYCGLASGSASGSASLGLFQHVDLTLKFSIVGQTMTITGTARKNGIWAGWVVGEWVVQAPPGAENSCLNKSARTFTTAGSLDIVIKTLLP